MYLSVCLSVFWSVCRSVNAFYSDMHIFVEYRSRFDFLYFFSLEFRSWNDERLNAQVANENPTFENQNVWDRGMPSNSIIAVEASGQTPFHNKSMNEKDQFKRDIER